MNIPNNQQDNFILGERGYVNWRAGLHQEEKKYVLQIRTFPTPLNKSVGHKELNENRLYPLSVAIRVEGSLEPVEGEFRHKFISICKKNEMIYGSADHRPLEFLLQLHPDADTCNIATYIDIQLINGVATIISNGVLHLSQQFPRKVNSSNKRLCM